ncbi:uncharacterized protein C2845_PM11G18050 [Panicum miliaceum]|uniref:DUF6598 domain-containing protein n=1 Tax=Panicum miliaceum TaxID=4540 RepID=A0A3L6RUV8_PANMI|nr:uncharacterized protein C2845_PM11G18050 [Panicum miliaceum]
MELGLPHVDDRNVALLQPNLTWEEKVVKILHMARCRELTEYNKKLGVSAPTRFCAFNIAFFDLDKESEGAPWKPIHKIPSPHHGWLADSVNVMAIKVAESDKGYPISVFGTVLARDEYDYRCVYLFKRGRDDPQVITSKDDTLSLMGPYRALAVSDNMYFEFHLKIKGDGDIDEDFSKGYLQHSAVRHSKQPTTNFLYSCLSAVELVYTPVPSAVEASFTVSLLKGRSDFIDKVTAWTTGNERNKIILYNKKVAPVGGDGSIHGLVAVPVDEKLVLRVCLFVNCKHEQGECFQRSLGHGDDECLAGKKPFELQVKISWRGVTNRRGYSPRSWGRPNMWWNLGTKDMLLL